MMPEDIVRGAFSGNFIWNIDHMLNLARKAQGMFEESLQQGDFASFQEKYYLARDMLRQSESYYNNALENVRAMRQLPPEMLIRLTESTKKTARQEAGGNRKVLPDALLSHVLSQLEIDTVLLRWMSPEEIRTIVKLHLPAQLQGKRKIANFKLRIAFEKVQSRLAEVRGLAEKSRLRYLQLRSSNTSDSAPQKL